MAYKDKVKQRQAQKRWRERHKEEHAQHCKKWREDNPEKQAAYMRDYFLDHHNEKAFKEMHNKSNHKYRRKLKMKNKFEEISAIVREAYNAELPKEFNYDTILEWMKNATLTCKKEIASKFPEVPTRISLYEQKALEQFQAFVTFVLDDGPHFSILAYTWNPEKTGDEYTMKKIELE